VRLAPPSPDDDLVSLATEVGTPVRLYLEESGGAFQTSVSGVDGENLVLAPVFPSHGNLVMERLLPRVRIELNFGGLPHVASCRVLAASDGGILLEKPRELERVQRRRYLRVPAPAGLELRIQAGAALLTRRVIDVSGNGCAVRGEPGDERLAFGHAVDFIHLPVGPPPGVITAATVKRVATHEGPRGEESVVGREFADLSPADRCRLISWVTETERAQLRLRALDRPRPVADTIVLLHDDAVGVRLKPGGSLSASGVSVNAGPADDDLVDGSTHPRVELRVGGARILSAKARVEASGTGNQVFLRFLDLDPGQKSRLAETLQR
jgi:c-di-GMP-binding flagellar brake protein YcgR